MGAKEFKFSIEARDKMLRGIDTLAGAVRVTLGPKGRNVALDKSFGPRITKDGVTVANEIQLEEPLRTWPTRWSSRSHPRPLVSRATVRRPPLCSPIKS